MASILYWQSVFLISGYLKDNVVRLIKDVRFFLNTLNRAVGVMVDAGIGATVDRQENEDGITLTINIPHAKS